MRVWLRSVCLAVWLVAGAAWAGDKPASSPCSAPEHHQFDFWIGHWDVFLPNGSKAGENRIEPIEGGCALLEQWSGARGPTGKSLNIYDALRRIWHQTWVDSSNSRVEFAGGLADGRMVLLGYWKDVNGPGQSALIRMTYSKTPDGSVRQHGEQSTDHGLNWSTNFDFTYHPKAKAAP